MEENFEKTVCVNIENYTGEKPVEVIIRKGEAAKAFTTAIEKCGELLAENFPPHEENPNEIPDGLVILEDAEW